MHKHKNGNTQEILKYIKG